MIYFLSHFRSVYRQNDKSWTSESNMQQKFYNATKNIVSEYKVCVTDEYWTPTYSETSFRTKKTSFYDFDSIFHVRYRETKLTLVNRVYYKKHSIIWETVESFQDLLHIFY